PENAYERPARAEGGFLAEPRRVKLGFLAVALGLNPLLQLRAVHREALAWIADVGRMTRDVAGMANDQPEVDFLARVFILIDPRDIAHGASGVERLFGDWLVDADPRADFLRQAGKLRIELLGSNTRASEAIGVNAFPKRH